MKNLSKKNRIVVLIIVFIVVFLVIDAIMEKRGRLACYGIPNEQAIKLARDEIKRKMSTSSDFQRLDALSWDVIRVEENLDPVPSGENADYYAKTVVFGRGGKRLERVDIYADCGTEWSS